MRWLLLIMLMLAAGYSPSYVMPQAATRLEFSSTADLEAAYGAIKAKLIKLNFDETPDEPVPDFMLENVGPAGQWRMIHAAHFSRERGGLLDRESLFIRLTPYPDASAAYEPFTGYNNTPPRAPFLEFHMSEARPDGFSRAAFALRAEMAQVFLTQKANIVELASGPASDDRVYFDYMLNGLLLAVAWWLVAWTIFMTLIGWPASWLIANFDWSLKIRRLALVAVGGLLVTPIPVPTTLITVPLPNVMLVWTPGPYVELLAYQSVVIAIMFGMSFFLSTLAAMIFIRNRDAEPA